MGLLADQSSSEVRRQFGSPGALDSTSVSNIIERGKLTLDEQQYFVEQVTNRPAYFAGSIFANDQYRDEEMRLQF